MLLDMSVFLESKPILYTLIFFGATAVAIWASSIYWVYQDIFSRTKNSLLQIASIVVAILFPFFGLLVYILLRPSLTIEERRLQLLDEKIMRKQVGDLGLCPQCRKSIEDTYLFCPHCKTKLKESCPKCDKPIDKKFQTCPYCGYDIKRPKDLPNDKNAATQKTDTPSHEKKK